MLISRFNELNVKEQAIIVENEMSKMVNNESETMVKVHHNYWNILDAQLISHLSNKSMIKDNDSTNKVRFKEVKHQSNIDILLDVVSVGINEIMINSPIDLLNTKVFLTQIMILLFLIPLQPIRNYFL